MTCLVAIIYISLVFALLLWCRNKRQKSRDSEDAENKEENDDTASDGDEKEVNLPCQIAKSFRLIVLDSIKSVLFFFF
jgi:hypothetical protein